MAAQPPRLLVDLGCLAFVSAGLAESGGIEQQYAQGVDLFQAGRLDPAEQEFVAVSTPYPNRLSTTLFLEKLSQAKIGFKKAEKKLEEGCRLRISIA